MEANIFLKHGEVKQAAKTLHQLAKKEQGKGLTEDFHFILQLSVNKVPKIKDKILKIALQHSVWTPTSEVCLIIKDSNEDPDVSEREMMEKLKSQGIESISQVICIRRLKKEYRTYETKRNLSNGYDVFLADLRVLRILPGLLGKSVYGRNRNPIPVKIADAETLKDNVRRALTESRFIISDRGSTSQALVGSNQLSSKQIADNVICAADMLCKDLPGGKPNIKTLHLKLSIRAPPIPLYSNFDPGAVVLPDSQEYTKEDLSRKAKKVSHKDEFADFHEFDSEFESESEEETEPKQKKLKT